MCSVSDSKNAYDIYRTDDEDLMLQHYNTTNGT
jgi:hypothetical protein